MADKAIEVLLGEKRNFPPPKQFKKSAHAKGASGFYDVYVMRPGVKAGIMFLLPF